MSLNKEQLLNFLAENDSTIDDVVGLLRDLSLKNTVAVRSEVSQVNTLQENKDLKSVEVFNLELINCLLSNSQDLIYFKDKDLNYINASKSLVTHFGLDDSSDLIGKKRTDLINDPNLNDESDDRNILSGNLPYILDKVTKTVDLEGNEKWMSCSKWPYLSASGDIMGIVGISKDVTKELILKEKMQKYLDLFNKIGDGYILYDSEKQIVIDLNQSFKEMFAVDTVEDFINKLKEQYPDITFDQLRSMNFSDLIYNNDDGTQILLEIENGEFGKQGLTYTRFHNLKNREKAFKIRNFILELSEAINTSGNITEFFRAIHKSLEKLMFTDNFYVALYDENNLEIKFPYYVDKVDNALPEGKKIGKGLTDYVISEKSSLLIDKDGFRKLESTGAVELIGEPAEYWLGVPLVANNNVLGAIVAQSYDQDIKFDKNDQDIFEFIAKEISNKLEFVKLKEQEKSDLNLLRQKERELSEINTKLKSEQIRLRDIIYKLEETGRELEAKNKEIYKFFSIIAHDIRNPLWHISIFVDDINEILQSHRDFLKSIENIPNDLNPQNKESVFETVNKLKSTSSLMQDQVLNLLNLANLKIKGIDEKPSEINLKNLIDGVIKRTNENISKKKITVLNELKEQDVLFQCEKTLDTTFYNLLANAIKFSFEKGVIIIDKAEQKDGVITLRISDSGMGMNEEKLKSIFVFGENVSTIGTMGEKGTGLGLPLVKEFLTAIGCEINVRSSVGEGTTFYVKIPEKLKDEKKENI